MGKRFRRDNIDPQRMILKIQGTSRRLQQNSGEAQVGALVAKAYV